MFKEAQQVGELAVHVTDDLQRCLELEEAGLVAHDLCCLFDDVSDIIG
jgi:hypothetical protein